MIKTLTHYVDQYLFPVLIGLFWFGGALSYHHVRPYHLLGLILLPWVVVKVARMPKKYSSLEFWFIFLLIAWYLASFLWAKDKEAALKYFFYIANGTFIVICLSVWARTEENLSLAIKAIGVFVFADIAVALLESTGLFRWPISRVSFVNGLFGLPEMYEFYSTDLIMRKIYQPEVFDFLMTQPSSYHWGPNQLSYALSVVFPFIIIFLSHKKLLSALLTGVIFFLLYMIASRAAMMGFLFSLALVALSFYLVSKSVRAVSFLLFSIIVALSFVRFEETTLNPERIFKLQSVFNASAAYAGATGKRPRFDYSEITTDSFSEINELAMEESEGEEKIDGSVSKRRLMLNRAYRAFKKRPLLGVGAGNSWQFSGMLFGKSQIHNFWAEVLFETGLLFFSLILAWAGLIVTKLIFILRSKSHTLFRKKLALACLIALIANLPSALAVGTLAYQTPFWILIAISIACLQASAPANPALESNMKTRST